MVASSHKETDDDLVLDGDAAVDVVAYGGVVVVVLGSGDWWP